jgi:hypothetical protein
MHAATAVWIAVGVVVLLVILLGAYFLARRD